jgi:hypothetical protein
MNRKLIPAAAAFLIVVTILGMTPGLSAAQVFAIGPKLEVTTIPQDDQWLEKGIMILGLDTALAAGPKGAGQSPFTTCVAPHSAYVAAVKAAGGADAYAAAHGAPECGPQDLMSQHKLLVTYNGLPMTWHIGSTEPQPLVFCNFVEKDKTNVVADPKTGLGKQGTWENLMTTMVDVSKDFVCKARWKSPAPGLYESAGVLDVYYTGAFDAHFIADTIMVVEVALTLGHTIIYGSDIQDICVMGWGILYDGTADESVVPNIHYFDPSWMDYASDTYWYITKPDGTYHYIWANAMASYESCDDVALIQKQALGISLAAGPDPLSAV